MKGFVSFLKRRWVLCLLVILMCGAVGSLKGASVESWMSADVVNEIPSEEEAGVTVPYMTGLFDLAAQQNMWISFRYAGICMLAGAAAALVIAAFLYRSRRTKWFRAIDRLLYGEE